jgi:S1-C subfamily serine protease
VSSCAWPGDRILLTRYKPNTNKGKLNKTILPLALPLLILTQVLDARADTIPEIVAQAKRSLLEIDTIDSSGNQFSGTGFFIGADGLAITNFHVIAGASQIVGRNMSGAVYPLERIYFLPPHADLAVLKFSASDVPYLRLGYSPSAVEGQRILVIGNPATYTGTVSDGLISAFPRESFIHANQRSYFSGLRRFPCHGRTRQGYRCSNAFL